MEQADSKKVSELLEELVLVCKDSSQTAALFHDNLQELWPSLQGASSHTLPKLQLLQEQRILLASSQHPQRLIQKIEELKDAGVQGIDRYIWLVGQIITEPSVKQLLSKDGGLEPSVDQEFAEPRTPEFSGYVSSEPPTPNFQLDESFPSKKMRESENMFKSVPGSKHRSPSVDDGGGQPGSASWISVRSEKIMDVPKSLIEGVSYPATPRWNIDRPYLTGQLFPQSNTPRRNPASKSSQLEKESNNHGEMFKALSNFSPSVQELLVIEDLLSAMVGIEGKYVCVRRGRHKEGNSFYYQLEPSLDASLSDLAKRILPLCENYVVVSQFSEARSHFKHGLVNHAFASALRAILQDYHAMTAQLEHQYRLGRLSLQGLWFFCQPMVAAMQVLSTAVQRAIVQQASGAAMLNLLQKQAIAMAGDNSARSLLQKLIHAASTPYFGILERWVYEGVIDDPYGEFLINENKSLQKESLSQDYYATYWQQRYSLRQEIPGFLASYAETILTTGKYLNAIRECGHIVQVPSSENGTLMKGRVQQPVLERINVAHDFASAELLNLIIHKFDLIGRLRSVKHYFFVDQGDFLVHFMDTARDELTRKTSAMSVEKLQSLLELALRTSVAASDPYHEDLACSIEELSLMAQLHNIVRNGNVTSQQLGSAESANAPVSSGITTGLETFTLEYKVRWPLSLVISRKALTKYQLIFRHIFHCKHVERQLCATWQMHQSTVRTVNTLGTAISRSYVVCQRMLHFLQTFQHYMTFEVLEPNWHLMHGQLLNAKSIDEVMQHHDAFLEKCLRQCTLLWPQILKKVDKLKFICLKYATATQWLIPAIFRQNDHFQQSGPTDKRSKKGYKERRGRLEYPMQARQAAEDSNFKLTIGKIDEEFFKELKLLVVLLSNGSQSDPCLAHLAQGLQGVA